MKRPTDEATAKVVAKWKGWMPNDIDMDNDGCFGVEYGNDSTSWCPDPRDDPDEAMKLLHYIMDRYGNRDTMRCLRDGWEYTDANDVVRFIPISGDPLRFAVVHLAIKVLETKDD